MEESVQRVSGLAQYPHFGEQRESRSKSIFAKVRYFGFVAGLLIGEIIAREGQDFKPSGPVFFIKFLQPLILWGEPAARSDVHDQQNLAPIPRQFDGVALKGPNFYFI